MHPLTTDLAEQILALIRIQSYSLLGAIQDNKTVLGGSAGSGGGTGDPPAGFVGQLTQSNVTFDTAGSSRACSAGSAGSSSLVDNLDAMRLGHEICDDAIKDRHIDWGSGPGQVSVGGGLLGFSQIVTVAPSGGSFTLVEDACDYITALGDSGYYKPYLIWVSGGSYVEANTNDIRVPVGTTLRGQGESTLVDLGDYEMQVSANAGVENMIVQSTGDYGASSGVIEVDGNDVTLRNVRAIMTNGSWGTVVEVYGAPGDWLTGVELYNVTCEATANNNNYGFYIYRSTVLMHGCVAYDKTNFWTGLSSGTAGNPSIINSRYCSFGGHTNDVYIVANNTWNHFACNFDPDASTIDGIETPLPHGRSYFKGGLRTRVVADDVSDPPTDAELDTAFGQPATLGEGFMGIVDDNDAQAKTWLAVTGGSTWWHQELTKAV